MNTFFDGLFKDEIENKNLKKSNKKNSDVTIPKVNDKSEAHQYKVKPEKKYHLFNEMDKDTQDRLRQELDTDRYYLNSTFPLRRYIPIALDKTPDYSKFELTESFINEVCTLISEGNFKESVFDYLKVPSVIYKEWLERGASDYDNCMNESIYAYLYGEILRAISNYEFNMSSEVKKQRKEWRASAWHLQRWNNIFKDSYTPDVSNDKNAIEQLKFIFDDALNVYKDNQENFNINDMNNDS